jgi:hypothetical protein
VGNKEGGGWKAPPAETVAETEADDLVTKKVAKGVTRLWNGRSARIGTFMAQDENGDDVYGDTHEILLYRHRFARRELERLTGKQLCVLARDYEIAQKPSEPIKKVQTQEQLDVAERGRVVYATYQMCAEGVDIPAIDTQILASPVSDAEQAVGRIRRFCIPESEKDGDKSPEDCQHYCAWRAGECLGKPTPMVADIVDTRFPLTSARSKYRLDLYSEIGSKVSTRKGT